MSVHKKNIVDKVIMKYHYDENGGCPIGKTGRNEEIMTEKEREAYLGFMYNKANTRNCKECPESRGFTPGADGNILPCGQYHCWVSVHCDQ